MPLNREDLAAEISAEAVDKLLLLVFRSVLCPAETEGRSLPCFHAKVARAKDHAVGRPEGLAIVPVRHGAFAEEREEDVLNHLWRSSFDFVEKNDGGAMESQAVGKKTAQFVTDIARRRASPSRNSVWSFRAHLTAMKVDEPAIEEAVGQTTSGIGLLPVPVGPTAREASPRPAVPVRTAGLTA